MSALADRGERRARPPESGPRARDAQWVLVACDCGRLWRATPRQARAIRAGVRSGRCDYCIYRVPVVVTDAERGFWLARFSLAEIVEMATAAWGPPPTWDESWRAGITFTLPPALTEAA